MNPYVITSQYRYLDNIVNGLAIPIVGVAVGAVSSLSSASAASKQADAQADAIASQQEATYQNTQLQLIELERQKQYANHLATIDEARQAQIRLQDDAELSVAQLTDKIATDKANTQNDAQNATGTRQNNLQMQRSQQQTGNISAVGNAQLDSNYFRQQSMDTIGFNNQQQAITQDYLGNKNALNAGRANQQAGLDYDQAATQSGLSLNALGQQMGLDSQFQGAQGNADIQEQGDFLQSQNLDRASMEAQFGKQTEAFNVEAQSLSEGARTLQEVARAFVTQRRQGRESSKGRASSQAQLSASGGGAGSRSQAALLEDSFEADLEQFSDTILSGGRAADMAISKLGLSQAQAQTLRDLGASLGGSLSNQAQGARANATGQKNISKAQSQGDYSRGSSLNAANLSNQSNLATTRYNAQSTAGNQQYQDQYGQSAERYGALSSQLAQQKSIQGVNARDEYVLNQLALADEVKLRGMDAQSQYMTNKMGISNAYENNKLNIGDAATLNKIGYDAYESARNVQFGIEQATNELNKQFYDTALSSASATIKTSAAAEMASLRASRESIQSPGLLSYVGIGLNAAQGLANALPQNTRTTTSQSPTYSFASNTTLSPFTAQPNSYGVISGFQAPRY